MNALSDGLFAFLLLPLTSSLVLQVYAMSLRGKLQLAPFSHEAEAGQRGGHPTGPSTATAALSALLQHSVNSLQTRGAGGVDSWQGQRESGRSSRMFVTSERDMRGVRHSAVGVNDEGGGSSGEPLSYDTTAASSDAVAAAAAAAAADDDDDDEWHEGQQQSAAGSGGGGEGKEATGRVRADESEEEEEVEMNGSEEREEGEEGWGQMRGRGGSWLEDGTSSREKLVDDRGAVKGENGLGRLPPMGWNSWNHFGCNVTEGIVRAAADALVSSGLASLGYKYVNVDDCWAELLRDEKGNLAARGSTFPSGIASLADYVHRLGLKFGIYSDAGFFTCAGQPGSLGFEERDAQQFADWGVDYLKYDNCFSDLSKPQHRYRRMWDALNATGRPIFFSMCEWGVDNPALWASSMANSWRTTRDIQDSWQSMLHVADENEKWAAFAAPGGWNDPDMLEVGNGGMSSSEYRVHFSLWAIMKAPLLLGCDLTSMSQDTLTIIANSEVIAVNQDPLGAQATRQQQSQGLEVWGGPLSASRFVLALINRSSRSAMIQAKFSELGISSSSAFRVRDLWERKTLDETITGSLSVLVQPHDVALFTLTPSF